MFRHDLITLQEIETKLKDRLEQIEDDESHDAAYQRYGLTECLQAVEFQMERLDDPDYVSRQSRTLQNYLGDEEYDDIIRTIRSHIQQYFDDLESRYNDPKEADWSVTEHLTSANFSFWKTYEPGSLIDISHLSGFVSVERMRELADGESPTEAELAQFEIAAARDEIFHYQNLCKVHTTAIRSHTGVTLFVVGFIDSNFVLIDHLGPFASYENAQDTIDRLGASSDWIWACNREDAEDQDDEDEEAEDGDEEVAE